MQLFSSKLIKNEYWRKKTEIFFFFSMATGTVLVLVFLFFSPFAFGMGALLASVLRFILGVFTSSGVDALPLINRAGVKNCYGVDTFFVYLNFNITSVCYYISAGVKSFILALLVSGISFIFASFVAASWFIGGQKLALTPPIKKKTGYFFWWYLQKIFYVLFYKVIIFIMAFPHVAFVLSLSFLLAPSGLFFRIIAPLFNWTSPPDIFLVADNLGLFYVFALSLREIPFLLFFMLVERNKSDMQLFQLAQVMGKNNFFAWLQAVFPSMFARAKLPLMLVFAYSLCNVEIGLIGGPQNFKLLSVEIFQLLYLYEESAKNLAAVLAVGLSFFLLLGVVFFVGIEKIVAQLYYRHLEKGFFGERIFKNIGGIKFFFLSVVRRCFVRYKRGNFFAEAGHNPFAKRMEKEAPKKLCEQRATKKLLLRIKTALLYFMCGMGYVVWAGQAAIFAVSFLLLVFWSIALRWPFPKLLPQGYTLKFWQQALLLTEVEQLWQWTGGFLNFYSLAQLQAFFNNALLWVTGNAVSTSLLLAFFSTLAAVVVSLLCLESLQLMVAVQKENSSGLASFLAKKMEIFFTNLWLLMLPLLFFPELVIVPGVQQFFLYLDVNYFLACLWGHFLFVFPYTYLTMRKPYMNFNSGYITLSQLMGKSYWEAIIKVKWRILFRPIIFSAALAATVSFAQYLSTLFFGGGRIITVTTEAVSLFQSGNRRVVAVYGVLQLALPLFVLFVSIFFANKFSSKAEYKN